MIVGPLKKRTRRLDEEREVALSPGVWTTAGEIAMGEGDKEQLSHNLRAQKKQALIGKLVERVHQQAAKFLEGCFMELAPLKVVESYKGSDGGALFLEWMDQSGIGFEQDGLKTVIIYKGRPINELNASVPPEHRSAVEKAIKDLQLQAIIKQ